MASKNDRIESIFNAALEKASTAERRAYLEGACGEDHELRQRVEDLLKSAQSAGSFLENPIVDADATVLSKIGEPPGAVIDRYKILQLIGEGGFGSVYMAEQLEPVKRKVALKIIKLGMDTRQVIARFEAERQALALMDHTNIARVFDAGATESGRPYFVMELVKGITITEYCDQHKLTTRQRLELFLHVCYALQHAHQKGVIHRDIKPSNVLVTLHNSRPVPKVIDFGIAKATSQRLTEKTLFTEFRQFLGTPEYMSPDQAEISGLDVDTRTDIYSLGVLLYELLTGVTPFDAQTLRKAPYDEIQRIIREEEPPIPSTRVATMAASGQSPRRCQINPADLRKLLRGDLDWIVMKAMDKDRTRRYDSAGDFANDIIRHLNDEPVLAGPPSFIYRTKKFIRRHRIGVLAGSAVVAAVLIGLAVSTTFYFQARHDRDAARVAEAHADLEARRSQRIADFLQDLFVSTSPDQAIARNVDVLSVMQTARDVFGDDHVTVAATLSSRALQLQSAGELEAAEQLYKESLRIWREAYGHDNINTGDTFRALGMLNIIKGDDLAAEQALRESIRITKSFAGDETVTLSESLALLAGVLTNRNQYDEAVELYRESVRVRRAVAPQQKMQIAVTLNAQVNAMMMAGREKDLDDEIDDLLDAWRNALPPNSRLLGRIFTEIGVWYDDHDQFEPAELQFRAALDIFDSLTEQPQTYYAAAVRRLINLLRKQKRYVDIIPLTLRYVDFARKLDSGNELLAAQSILADVCWTIAKQTDAPDADYDAALQGVETYLQERPSVAAVVNTKGVLLYRLERYDEALQTLRRSDEYYTEENGVGVPQDVAFIAMSCFKLNRTHEARAALDRLRKLLESDKFSADREARQLLEETEMLLEPPSTPDAD